MHIFTSVFRSIIFIPFLFLFVVSSVSKAQNINIDKFQYLFPVPNSKLNSTESNIIIRFGVPFKDYGIENGLVVSGNKSGIHKGKILLTENNMTILFIPDLPFSEGETVTVKFVREIKTDKNEIIPMLNFSFQVTKQDLSSFIKKNERKFLVKEYSDLIRSNNYNLLRKESNNYNYSVLEDSLAHYFPSYKIDSVSNPFPGFMFFTPFYNMSQKNYDYLIITDNYGVPIFYRQHFAFLFDFKRQSTGILTHFYSPISSFLALDSSYNVIDTFSTKNGYITDMHEMLVLENKHSLMMSYDWEPVSMDTVVSGGNPNALVAGLIIQEQDENKNVVFQWRSWDHFKITDATYDINLTDSLIDYVHGNAIDIDKDGNILISSRHMDEITKINRQTGNIIWRLGGEHCKNNQFTFVNDPIGFSHQHNVRKMENGNITLFDNGNLHSPSFSRASEYQLDEENKLAFLVWEYRNDPVSYSIAMGNTQRLPNHNTIIGWGTGTSPAISEVKPNGEVALFLTIPDTMYNYRGFKFPWKTNLFVGNPESLVFGYVPLGDSLELPLEIINNSDKQIEINSTYNRDSVYTIEASLPISFAPFDKDTILVKFKPISEGDYFDDLHLRWDTDGQRIAQVVPLIGSTDPNFTAVNETVVKPKEYNLSQNYPNPFNPTTQINYSVPKTSLVTIKVYDILGKEVATLVNKEKTAGNYPVQFNATSLSSGVYFYRLQAGDYIETKKMILLK